MSALDRQVGGGHYKQFKIQPIEFAMANNLNPIQTLALRYLVRYPFKNGLEDIDKCIHLLEMAKEFFSADDVEVDVSLRLPDYVINALQDNSNAEINKVVGEDIANCTEMTTEEKVEALRQIQSHAPPENSDLQADSDANLLANKLMSEELSDDPAHVSPNTEVSTMINERFND